MKVWLMVLLGLFGSSMSSLGHHRGRERGQRSFIQRGGRELPGYEASTGGRQGQSQYGGSDGPKNEGCEESDGGSDGGIDFSGCEEDPETGFCCVEKQECINSLSKDPILECTHKNVEQCHYTYVTQFTPTQQEICEENFEKTCSITFKQQAYNETVEKCYTPIEKVCNGQGEEVCETVYESSCTTKYVEKQPGKFVGDTSCEKLPTELCGAGCTYEEGLEECHDKVVTTLVDTPEEVCDLNPQKTCRYTTKLVPKLKPKHECTIVPKETCTLKFTTPKQVKKPLLTKWCLDPTEPTPGESYDEENAFAPVLGSGSAPAQYGVPAPSQPPSGYGAPTSSTQGGYRGPTASAPTGYGSPPTAPTGGYRSSSPTPTEYESPADNYGAPNRPDNEYGAPPLSSPDSYGAPVSNIPGSYDAPASGAPGRYGAPSSSSESGGYAASPRGASGGYNAPIDSYAASRQSSNSFSNFDDSFQSPSAQASDIYNAPGPLDGGYNAPSPAAGGYGAPALDKNYQSSRIGRKLRNSRSKHPRRPIRG